VKNIQMKNFILLLIVITGLIFQGCSSANEKTKKVKIGICSDVHLPTMHDSERRITAFIDSMKIAKPDFIIELGDFGIPKKEYLKYFDIWNSFPAPKYHVIGNHEMDGGTSMDKALAFREMKNPYYSFEMKGFKFIVLDGNDKQNSDEKGYRSYMGNKQLAWLGSELNSTKKPVVIFSHQGIGHDPGIPGERYSIVNSKEVRKIFEEHNRSSKEGKVICCFNGHTHQDYAEDINGIWYVTINSMSYYWLGEEYEHIRYSNEVDKEFKWIKYTAPYRDPLFAVVEISTDGTIKIEGKNSEFVGPSPWELGYPEQLKKYVAPRISSRLLEFEIK
jgi:predicted phosphodiesterase